MPDADDIASILSSGSRVIMIAEKGVDLRPTSPDNCVFLLKISEGSLAAGGRGGGFGERKVVRVLCYELKGGEWTKAFDLGEPAANGFEVPYYVSRLPFTLRDGAESVGYGVVEPDLVRQMKGEAARLSA